MSISNVQEDIPQYSKATHLYTFTIDNDEFAAWLNSGWIINKRPLCMEGHITTILPVPSDSDLVDAKCLRKIENGILSTDFSHSAFRAQILLDTRDRSLHIADDAAALLDKWGVSEIADVFKDTDGRYGPYLSIGSSSGPIYKLFTDSFNTFIVSFQPTLGGVSDRHDQPTKHPSRFQRNIFRPLFIGSETNNSGKVAVGPRGASLTTKQLQGMRMTVKDMFEIDGHRMGLGSRAFRKLSQPAQKTAPMIQLLLDAGASLVGVTHMCAMIGKQEPTQSLDYPAPFNPRGDGWQSPSGGSSGQAAAVGAYEWLDFAIGSDSTQSGRLPAQANGCFSYRPSRDFVDAEGMWSAVPQFDRPCVFSTSIFTIQAVAKTWKGSSVGQENSLPTAIFAFSDFLPSENEPQMAIFESFVKDFGKVLGLGVKRPSIRQSWSKFAPEDASGERIEDFLNTSVANNSYVFGVWQKIRDFYQNYEATFGEKPFMPLPGGIHLWDDVKDTTHAQSEEAWAKISVYRMWVLDKLLQQGKENAIVIMPLGNVKPCYRDEWPETPAAQQLWEPLLLAPILGAPEVVVPAGQIQYKSRVNGNWEYLPVCVSVMGLPGIDVDLIELIGRFLQETGRSTVVMTGKTMFPI